MQCLILIDQRERAPHGEKLIDHMLKKKDWAVGQLAVTTLNTFDVILEDQGVMRAGFERKIPSDLIASHRTEDGRWKEQLARIVTFVKEHPKVVVGYIIEGDLALADHGQFNPEFILHSLWELSLLNITVTYTKNITETCDFLCHMAFKFSQSLSIEESRHTAEENRALFKGKKREVTEEEMLFQTMKILPNVSPKHARAISNEYVSLITLCATLGEDSTALLGLKIDATRRIGKTLSEKIFRFLDATPNQIPNPVKDPTNQGTILFHAKYRRPATYGKAPDPEIVSDEEE